MNERRTAAVTRSVADSYRLFMRRCVGSLCVVALLACTGPDQQASGSPPDQAGTAGLNGGAGAAAGPVGGAGSSGLGVGGSGNAPGGTGNSGGGGTASQSGNAAIAGSAGAPRDPGLPLTATCPQQAVFCESFEENPLAADRWSTSGMAGSVTIDATQSVDGKSSLHLRSGTEYGLAPPFAASLLKHIPATNDRIYMRVYMRYADLTLPGYHPNLITVTDGDYDVGHWPDFSIWSFGWFWNDFSINGFGRGLDGAKIWMEAGNEQQAGGFYLGDKTPAAEQWLKVDQWYCLEVMGFGDSVAHANTNGDGEEVRVWIDEMEIEGLHADDAYWKGYGAKERWSPKYDGSLWSFGIGGQAPQNGQKIDIWYDALAFASERIGCAK